MKTKLSFSASLFLFRIVLRKPVLTRSDSDYLFKEMKDYNLRKIKTAFKIIVCYIFLNDHKAYL